MPNSYLLFAFLLFIGAVVGQVTNCFEYNDCSSCSDYGCAWCSTSNSCQSETTFVCATAPVYCPCAGNFFNCDECVQAYDGNSCSWCNGLGTCVPYTTANCGETNSCLWESSSYSPETLGTLFIILIVIGGVILLASLIGVFAFRQRIRARIYGENVYATTAVQYSPLPVNSPYPPQPPQGYGTLPPPISPPPNAPIYPAYQN